MSFSDLLKKCLKNDPVILQIERQPNVAQEMPSVLERTRNRLVWDIPLVNGEHGFMCADRTNYLNDERFVVLVDCIKFYQFWRQSRQSHCPEYSNMWRDRKYADAEEGFSASLRSPAPLAEVSAYPRDGQPGVYFTNGITRTIWLIANGAKAFPVGIHGADEATFLSQYAGSIPKPCSVQELLSAAGQSNSVY